MSVVAADDQGRVTIPSELRDRYGDRFRVVDARGGIKLIPVADDTLATLRTEFDDVDGTATELRERARQRFFSRAQRRQNTEHDSRSDGDE